MSYIRINNFQSGWQVLPTTIPKRPNARRKSHSFWCSSAIRTEVGPSHLDLLNLLNDKEVRKKRQKDRGIKVNFEGATNVGRKGDLIERFQSKLSLKRKTE